MVAKKKEVAERDQSVLEKMAGTFNVDIDIDGKKWKCVSPKVEDHAKFYGTVYQAEKDDAKNYLKDLLEAGIEQELAVTKYDEKIKDVQPSQFIIYKSTNSLRGARFYFLACSHENHPELKAADVDKMVTEDNWEDVMKELNRLSPHPEQVKNE